MRQIFLWFLVVTSATALFISISRLLSPRRLSFQEAGGVEYVYQLDTKSLPPGTDLKDVANRAIQVLRLRTDPNRQKPITWQIVNHDDIQFQIPFTHPATPESLKARQLASAHENALFSLLKFSSFNSPELRAILILKPPERDDAIAQIAPRGSDEEHGLRNLAAAGDALQKANADLQAYKPGGTVDEATLLAAQARCQQQFDALLSETKRLYTDPALLQELASEADEDPDAAQELARLAAEPSPQKKQIDACLEAHQQTRAFMDPAEIEAKNVAGIVTRAGVVDFRIALMNSEVSPEELANAVHSLEVNGPDRHVKVSGINARWFRINPRSRNNLMRGDFVTSDSSEQPCILCYDEHDRTLTHSDPVRNPWFLSVSAPFEDEYGGGACLPFRLDATGASYMAKLTGDWKHHPIAILLDNVVMSAPTIEAQIGAAGTITFGTKGLAAKRDAQQLKDIVDAGSLPVVLLPTPLSTREVPAVPGYHAFPWQPLLAALSGLALLFSLLLAFQKPRSSART